VLVIGQGAQEVQLYLLGGRGQLEPGVVIAQKRLHSAHKSHYTATSRLDPNHRL
jgi:hypothetical protein